MEKGRIPPHLLIPLLGALVLVLSFFVSQQRIRENRRHRVEDRIGSMARLVTARQTYREIFYSKDKRWGVFSKQYLFSVVFNAEAGVDMDDTSSMSTMPGRRG